MQNEKRVVCEIDSDTNYKLRLHLLKRGINVSKFLREVIHSAIVEETPVDNQQKEIKASH